MEEQSWVVWVVSLLGVRLALESVALAVAGRVRNGKPVHVAVLGRELLYVGSVHHDVPPVKRQEQQAKEKIPRKDVSE